MSERYILELLVVIEDEAKLNQLATKLVNETNEVIAYRYHIEENTNE